MPNQTVYKDKFFEVLAPERPLNCREDGGHLIMVKEEPVKDRSDLSWQEAIDFMRISMAVGRAMYEVLGIERMNYEDLGNWSLDEPGGAKMHLHFMGRARHQVHQVRGQHIFLYPQGHPIYDGHLKPLSVDDVAALQKAVSEILQEDKFRKLGELAGV